MSPTGQKRVSNVSLTSCAVKATEGASKIALWIPIASSILYPWVLEEFHIAMTSGGGAGTPSGVIEGTIWLTIAFLLPLSCLAFTIGRGPFAKLAPIDPMTRRVAFAGVAAPPLFVLTGVVSGLLHSPVPERVVWVAAWSAVGLASCLAKPDAAPRGEEWTDRLRVVHGVSAALILLYVVFHLFNHLLGLVGPDLHARVMRMGREVYRSGLVEPVLVGLLLFQVASGLRLAWRLSSSGLSLIRAIQVGSGVYLAAFVLAHLNSAFISARAVRHIETDWAWAAGAPTGLIMDSWNIRLLPHYAVGVFFVVAHVFCGLRGVLLAHRVHAATADRIWLGGMMIAVVLSTAIMCGLCGVRI